MDPHSLLLSALIAVESQGNDRAVGDRGAALGALQIHDCVVHDVNRIAGTHFSHRDVYDRRVAVWMATVYLNYYATADRLGRPPTIQDRARIWVGGPDGYKQRVTLPYWRRVQKALAAIDRHHQMRPDVVSDPLTAAGFQTSFRFGS